MIVLLVSLRVWFWVGCLLFVVVFWFDNIILLFVLIVMVYITVLFIITTIKVVWSGVVLVTLMCLSFA